MKTALLVLACVFPAFAFAARPAPPVLTVNANHIKQLDFEWQPISGVTKYQLWFKPQDSGTWVKYTEKAAPRTALSIGVSVHLLFWPEARYQLKACNASGCSTSNTVRVNSEKLEAMGFFKADTPSDSSYFGGQLALSADGSTMAALASETVNGNDNSLVAYVYRWSTAGWHREARLLPSITQPGTAQFYLGDSFALSGDGNLLVVGSWIETGPAGNGNTQEAGAVYLFRRSGSTWHESQRIPSPLNHFSDEFGFNVALDDAGRTLVVEHFVAGADRYETTHEVYLDPADSSGQFVHDRTLNAPVVNGEVHGCGAGLALSGDGRKLFRTCGDSSSRERYVQVLDAPGFSESSRITALGDAREPDVTDDGSEVIMQADGAAVTYRFQAGTWAFDAYLGTFGAVDYGGGRKVAISRDGKIAAIGVPSDIAAGLGPIFPPYQTAQNSSGGAVIHEHKSSGWVLRRLVKPGSTNDQWAGWKVALGNDGRVLAVGAPLDSSAARGIDGDRDDESAPNRGAVWLY